MKVVCPSCRSPFEADDSVKGAVGLPLCEACVSSAAAPPPPPRAFTAEVADVEAVSAGDPWSEPPPAVRPRGGPDRAFLQPAAVLELESAIEPVSLRDLAEVLGPPSRWGTTPKPPAAAKVDDAVGSTAVKPKVVIPKPPAGLSAPTAVRIPAPRRITFVDAVPPPANPPPTALLEVQAPPPMPTVVALRAPRMPRDLTAPIPVLEDEPVSLGEPRAQPRAEHPPVVPEIETGEERAPDSGQLDLAKLAAAHPANVEKARRAGEDLFALQGALFGSARAKPPSLPPAPLVIDEEHREREPTSSPMPLLSLVPAEDAPPSDGEVTAKPPKVVTAEAPPRPPVRSVPDDPAPNRAAGAWDVEPIDRLPPPSRAPALLAPVIELSRSAPPSTVPGPVVSDRGQRRGGIASWAIAVAAVSISAAVIVVTLHDSGSNRPAATDDGSARRAPPEATARANVETTARADSVPTSAPITTSVAATTAARSTSPQLPAPVTAKPPLAAPATPPPTSPPRDLPAVPPPPPVATPAPPPSPGGAFDRGAAKAALAAAAGRAASCKQPDDPAGGARVSVTFSTSGRVSSALVTGPPFQGTRTGACIAGAFRGVTIPAFEGDPVVVSKDVTLR